VSQPTLSAKNLLNQIPLQYHDGHYELLDGKQWSYIKERYRMTQRELQIAQLVCRGLNNEDIARNLHIRQGTVKTHIRNIYRKTWVRSKVALFLRFMKEAQEMAL